MSLQFLTVSFLKYVLKMQKKTVKSKGLAFTLSIFEFIPVFLNQRILYKVRVQKINLVIQDVYLLQIYLNYKNTYFECTFSDSKSTSFIFGIRKTSSHHIFNTRCEFITNIVYLNYKNNLFMHV